MVRKWINLVSREILTEALDVTSVGTAIPVYATINYDAVYNNEVHAYRFNFVNWLARASDEVISKLCADPRLFWGGDCDNPIYREMVNYCGWTDPKLADIAGNTNYYSVSIMPEGVQHWLARFRPALAAPLKEALDLKVVETSFEVTVDLSFLTGGMAGEEDYENYNFNCVRWLSQASQESINELRAFDWSGDCEDVIIQDMVRVCSLSDSRLDEITDNTNFYGVSVCVDEARKWLTKFRPDWFPIVSR